MRRSVAQLAAPRLRLCVVDADVRQVVSVLGDELGEEIGIALAPAVLEAPAEQRHVFEAVGAADAAHAVTQLPHELEVPAGKRMAKALNLALAVVKKRGNQLEDRPLDQRVMLESPPHGCISPQAAANREGTPSRRRYFADWKTSLAQRKATTAAGTPQ